MYVTKYRSLSLLFPGISIFKSHRGRVLGTVCHREGSWCEPGHGVNDVHSFHRRVLGVPLLCGLVLPFFVEGHVTKFRIRQGSRSVPRDFSKFKNQREGS